jgi:hypothetical protein
MAVGLITAAQQGEALPCGRPLRSRGAGARDDVESELARARGQGAVPDPLDLLPKTCAWWLRRREEVRKLYATGAESP